MIHERTFDRPCHHRNQVRSRLVKQLESPVGSDSEGRGLDVKMERLLLFRRIGLGLNDKENNMLGSISLTWPY